jgi:hypothetical protein
MSLAQKVSWANRDGSLFIPLFTDSGASDSRIDNKVDKSAKVIRAEAVILGISIEAEATKSFRRGYSPGSRCIRGN